MARLPMSWLPVRRPATVAGPPRTWPRSARTSPVFLNSRSPLMVSQRCCRLLPVHAPLLTVVGIGADGWEGLSATSQAALTAAEVIIGSHRQLELLPMELAADRVLLPSPLVPAIGDLVSEHSDQVTAVLASGDPMFYGIGSTLTRLLGPDQVCVLPHPSSVSLAAARLGWALEDLEVVSLVGRPIELLHPAIQPGRRILVLVSGSTAAADIRILLVARGFGASTVTVLADLGAAAETVHLADGRPHSRLAIVAVECSLVPAAAVVLAPTPGLPDDAYDQDGQITKREIRAIVLAALVPIPGQLLWDVGAGSGSIGIEWMRTHPASTAIAVEPKTGRCARIARNATTLGVPGLRIVTGQAPQALHDLPPPDAIFIGGGVTCEGLVPACWNALSDGGRLVANAVTIEGEQALVRWRAELGGTLTRIAVERADALGTFTTWRPALPVVQWSIGKNRSS
jgi:precorrin-6B C5,15-methyltransferase / cobalt-precorrin-6B C5,C15-methyltransferase